MSIVQVVACSGVDGGCVVVFLVSKLCGYCGVGCLGQCVFSGGEDLFPGSEFLFCDCDIFILRMGGINCVFLWSACCVLGRVLMVPSFLGVSSVKIVVSCNYLAVQVSRVSIQIVLTFLNLQKAAEPSESF